MSQKGDIINLLGETYLVNNLPVPFIIDNNIRIPHKIDIIYNLSVEISALKISSKFIIIYNILFPDLMPESIRVKLILTDSVTIQLKIDYNVIIGHSEIPKYYTGYLIEPVPY